MRVAAALLALAAGPALAEGCAPDRLAVVGAFGEASFAVTIADDDAERAQGLMNVPSMPAFSGMLFVYEEEQPASFWMENTLIPLDMLFADATGTITSIHRDAVPLDRTPIPGGDRVKFVLELNGGTAERLGLAVGDTLRHPAIGPEAATPCP